MVTLGGLDIELMELGQIINGPRCTTTPALAAFLMLRRHGWFIPASS